MENNDSKYHMMRGMIALAWADDVLDPSEISLLERFIENNRHLTPTQREELKANIRTPISIANVWEQITDMQDRARLIDVAGAIFHADGNYSPKEKKVYDEMLQLHLSAMNRKATERDIAAMAAQAKALAAASAKKTQSEYHAEVKNTPEKAPSKMGLLIWRINQAMGS